MSLKGERYPAVEPDKSTIINRITVGTSLTRLVEGDYREYEVVLIADPDNSGSVKVGKGWKADMIFPLLKTQYLYIRCDLDKIKAIGTDAGDKVCIIMQPKRVIK